MSLINELNKNNFTAKDAERYLLNLSQRNPQQLLDEINENAVAPTAAAASSASGDCPLVIAIRRGDLELVEVLLSFDVKTTVKIQGRTIEEIAKEAIVAPGISEEIRLVRKKILALLQSRGAWQAAIAREQDISLSRSIRVIEEAVSSVSGADNKNGVLILGLTGEGKSTLINYLSGIEYSVKRVKGIRTLQQVDESQRELAVIGNTTISETLFPKVFDFNQGNYVLVDMPGFEDTRGTAEEICAAASTCMLTKQLQSVKTICCVISWNSMTQSRLDTFRKSAFNIGGMIGKDPSTARNVVLIVTKPDNDLEVSDVLERIKGLAEDEGFNIEGKIDVIPDDISIDVRKKMTLKNTLEAILASGENGVIIADVTKQGAANRRRFHEVFNPIVGKRPEQFDFNGYSRYMNSFRMNIEKILINHNELKRYQLSEIEKKQDLEKIKTAKNNELKSLNENIEAHTKQKNIPFTEESFNKSILAAKTELENLRKRYNESVEEKNKVNTEKAKIDAALNATNGNAQELKKIDTLDGSWICAKTEDRIDHKLRTVGAAMLADGRMAEMVELEEVRIPGVDKPVSQNVSHHSPVPIQELRDNSSGGKFVANSFTPGSHSITGTFSSAPGASGGVSLKLELWGNACDFPETKERLSKLNSELSDINDKYKRLDDNDVTSADIQKKEDELREFELSKVTALGDQRITGQICEMKIEQCVKDKAQVDESLRELEKQIDNINSNLEQSNLQLEVNRGLFNTLRNVCNVLGFSGDLIDQFKALYSNQAAGNNRDGFFNPANNAAASSTSNETSRLEVKRR